MKFFTRKKSSPEEELTNAVRRYMDRSKMSIDGGILKRATLELDTIDWSSSGITVTLREKS